MLLLRLRHMAEGSPGDAELIGNDAAEIQYTLVALKNQITTLQGQVRGLERRAKQALRARSRRKTGGAPRKPTGFARPVQVSSELLAFMGREAGELVARTDATRAVNAYIKECSLQDPDNARHIVPDKKLRELLFPNKGEDPGALPDLTYFNLQRYMNPHFKQPAVPQHDHSGE